jgi:hypothetical protein
MKLSIGDLVHEYFTNAGTLAYVQSVLLALAIGTTIAGAVVLIQARRRGTHGASSGLRRWPRATLGLALCAALLAVADLALRQFSAVRHLEELRHVSPYDVFVFHVHGQGYLALGLGLLISAFGLASGWLLEWVADGMAPREE